MVRALCELYRRLSALRSDRSGATAVITALILPVLVGFVGLGIDTANWYTNYRQMQRITEAAAMAAAPYLSNSAYTTAMVTAVAENVAALDGLSTTNGDTISVAVGSNPSTIKVTGTRKLPRYFSALFLPTAPVTTASSTAGLSTTANSVCILVLAASGSQTLLVNSGVTLDAPSCEIDVASTSSGAGMFDSSLPNVAKVCIAGTSTVNGGSTINNLTNSCTTASDPYTGLATPTIGSCTVNSENFSGTANLSPGTYCGNFNFNGSGTLNLAAGTYIFDNTNWNINNGWTINGTGVTFYFATSGSYIQFNSGVKANLSAPTSGTYANILMFEPAGLSTSSFAIDGTSTGHLLQGVIHLPSRNITFNAASNVTSDGLTLVVNTIIFDNVDWSISPGASTISSKSGSSSGSSAVLLD